MKSTMFTILMLLLNLPFQINKVNSLIIPDGSIFSNEVNSVYLVRIIY